MAAITTTEKKMNTKVNRILYDHQIFAYILVTGRTLAFPHFLSWTLYVNLKEVFLEITAELIEDEM